MLLGVLVQSTDDDREELLCGGVETSSEQLNWTTL